MTLYRLKSRLPQLYVSRSQNYHRSHVVANTLRNARNGDFYLLNENNSRFSVCLPFSSSSPQVDTIFEKILQLDTVEVHLLTELVNQKLGFKQLTPAQREAMARGGGGASAASQGNDEVVDKEEKTSFDVKLTGFDTKAKIKVIKEIRAITGLGLKEAKELVEGAPKVIKNDVKMEEAEEIKSKLEGIGGEIEIS